MTTKQRETIAKAVGAIWGCAIHVDKAIQDELWTVAKALDDMLTEDVVGKSETITCADAPMTYTEVAK